MEKPVVYITRKLPADAVSDLAAVADIRMWEEAVAPVPRDVFLEEAEQADAVLSMLSDAIDREFFEHAKKVKVVANLAVGYDNMDVEAARDHGVTVSHTPDVLTDTTADLTFALMMAAGRRMIEASDYIKTNQWDNWAPYLLAGRDVHHKTIGIVGMGRIGSAVAQRAKGFDMQVVYHNRSRKPDVEADFGAEYMSFDELLRVADFVVCLTPLTEETEGMFDRNAFQNMKSSAFFVNVSRGAVVDEFALREALDQEWIAGAGLDVFKDEPIAADHPLLGYKNVVALPHIGSASIETRTAMIQLACQNITNVLQGDAAVTPIK